MPIEVCAISGFSKTEGNSVAIKVNDEVVLLDMGLGMEDYIKFTEDREDLHTAVTYKQLLAANAVPNYTHINQWKEKVMAIIPSHGHLDHVGAVPFAAPLFPNAPVISTPYTIEILKGILYDEKTKLPNQLISINLGSSYKLSENITIEFINITHSIPHTAIVVLHTPQGKIMYVNDFKLDNQPVIGKKPDVNRLKEIAEEGVNLMILNCLYAHEDKKCASESVAREMLKDTMLNINSQGKAMIVTTFSSHLARLKSIIELGKQLKRKIVFLGRSLEKYIYAGENIGLIDFKNDIKIYRYRDKIEKILRKIQQEGKDKYLIVCTGHQGEPRAILSRIARRELDFRFDPGDIIIFSCQVIPVETSIENRAKLEKILLNEKVQIHRDVHVSGHGARKDHREILELVKPRNLMPIHAEPEKARMMADLARSLGFKNIHVMQDGQKTMIQ